MNKKVKFCNKNSILEYYENSKEKKYKKNVYKAKDHIISNILYRELPYEKDYIEERIFNKKYKSLAFIEDCYEIYQKHYNIMKINNNIFIYYKIYLYNEKNKEYIKIKIHLDNLKTHKSYIKEDKIIIKKNILKFLKKEKYEINYYKAEYKAKIKIIKIIRQILKKLKIN